MVRLDNIFEQKTEKLAHIFQVINKKDAVENRERSVKMASKQEVQFGGMGKRTLASRGPMFIMAEKASTRIIDKEPKILEKSQALKTKTFQDKALGDRNAGGGQKCAGAGY
jgi:hypothetical protein